MNYYIDDIDTEGGIDYEYQGNILKKDPKPFEPGDFVRMNIRWRFDYGKVYEVAEICWNDSGKWYSPAHWACMLILDSGHWHNFYCWEVKLVPGYKKAQEYLRRVGQIK